jgi:hypothetical protein
MTNEYRPLPSFFLLGILLVIAGAAHSHTWHVAQDGSGDFTVIQAAVDAAQDGDTISIGPGHYTEFTVVPGYGHHPDGGFVNVMLDGTKSLTFIGAGPEATIIGPLEYAPAYSRSQFGFLCAPGNAMIRVESLRVVNQDLRGMVYLCDQVELDNVAIEMCSLGVRLQFVNNALIESCVFVNSPHESPIEDAILSRAHTVVIRDTVVDNYWGGIFFSVGSTDVLVDNCQIIDAIVGVQFTQNASGVVQNCYLSGHQHYAIAANAAGTVIIRNNVIEDCPGAGIGFWGAQELTVNDNVISRTGVCVYITTPNVLQSVYNNHFLRYPEAEDGFNGYYIRTRDYYPFGPYYLDFTNNYWGTTDPEEISTWIYDGHDNSSVWMYVVFEPMADGPVPVQQQTWTEVKGLFRD